MCKSQTASFWTFSCEREFSFLLQNSFSSIEFLCKDVCFWNWERILLRDESGSYLQRALTVISLLGENYFGRQTFADVKCQILVQVHSQIYFNAQYKLHLPTLYCAKCLLMYFTFEKSQIELGTKVDPLWYSFSLWSEYFDIVPAPREPFPSPGTGRNNSTYASSSSSS